MANKDERITDPMTVEIFGEAWGYPAVITDDPDGVNLRRATRIIQAFTPQQFDVLLGTPEDWPEPGPHINARPNEQ